MESTAIIQDNVNGLKMSAEIIEEKQPVFDKLHDFKRKSFVFEPEEVFDNILELEELMN